MIHDEINPGGDPRSSSDIESDIRRTRVRMDATLDELREQLTVRNLLNSALDWWESRPASTRAIGSTQAQGAAKAVARQVKEYPMPAALIGAGIAWLIVDAVSDDQDDDRYVGGRVPRHTNAPVQGVGTDVPTGAPAQGYYVGAEGEMPESDDDNGPGLTERAKEKLMQGREAISGAAQNTRSKITGIGEAASGLASDLGGRARHTYQQGRSTGQQISQQVSHQIQAGYTASAEQFRDAVEEYPLAVGIGFAALGAMVGLLLPRSSREDEMLGARADHLLETVKEKGREVVEKGKAVAERVAGAALEEAEKQGFTAEKVGSALSGIASKAGEVVHRVTEEGKSALQEENLTPGALHSAVESSQEADQNSGSSSQGSTPLASQSPAQYPPGSPGCGC